MAVVNIPRDVKDEFYRYKMPALIAKVEGRGNGIKTVIVNMSDIAKSLARPPAYPTKFFGFELGSITTIEPANDKFIVNGKHDQSKLAQVLDDFIEKFVLCKKCQRNPETYMVIRSGIIELKCMACGGRSPVDNRHKLCTFILKNPPTIPTEYEKKAKQAAAKTKKATGEENGAEEEGNGKEEDKLPRTSSKNGKKKKPAREEEEDDDDVVWFTDTSKEAAEQRRKNMLDNTSELAAKLLNTGISEKESKPDPLADVNAFLATKPPPSNSAIAGQLKKTKEEYKLSDEDTARLAFLALFPTDVFKQLKTNKLDILKQFLTNEDAQRGALAAITELCKDAAGLKVVAHVLKYLYDEDALEEDAVLKWYGAKSKGDEKKVKEAAKVFVEWLENAEEDEDEDEEDDTDEEEEEEDEDEDEEEEDSD